MVSLTLLGLVLAIVACQAGPLMPTPTAVPLAETATLVPRPTRAAGATAAPEVKASLGANTPSPTTDAPRSAATASALIADVNTRLAKRTVTGFLDRLVSGNVTSIPALFLTESALEGPPAAWLAQLAGSEAQLAGATLHEFAWANDISYEARGELDWTQSIEGGATTQRIELIVIYQRGLWLIDEITLEPIGIETPTATAEQSLNARQIARSPGNLRNHSEWGSVRIVRWSRNTSKGVPKWPNRSLFRM